MLHQLPFETLNQIFSHFALTLPSKSDVFPDYRPVRRHGNENSELARHLQDRRTLLALCSVCSRCRAVASPMLYHTVILHDAPALPFFTRTLLEEPQAGDNVRALALLVAFNNAFDEQDLYNCVSPGLWADLGQWLFGEAAHKTRPDEFDWNLCVNNGIYRSEDDMLHIQVRERKLRTTKLVNDFKRDLCRWSGKRATFARPPMHELVQGLLYCILRETPRVRRLLLQFPPGWGADQNSFAKFRALHDRNASSSPSFCSSLASLILASNSKPPGYLKSGRRLNDQFPLHCFRSLETLMAVGPDTTFDPFLGNTVGIRHLHLLDTDLQPRTIGSMLLKVPQDLVSLVIKQRPSDPWYQSDLLDLPTEEVPTLSEVLLLKGNELRELGLVLCYTNCFRNFIGPDKRLTSLPTMERLEKLTIQMHLLFSDTRGFSAELLASRLPPNLVELNILDEWEMDVAERELWITRYVYHEDDPAQDPIEYFIEERAVDDVANGETHFCKVLHGDRIDGWKNIEAAKKFELYSAYRDQVRRMLLELAAHCDTNSIACQLQGIESQQGVPSLASLRSVTFQLAPNKPLKLVLEEDENQRYDGDWPHRLEEPPVKDSMENALAEIKAGSFLCWIPYRWTNLDLLREAFEIRDEEMSVRYIRDVVSDSEDDSDDEDGAGEDDENEIDEDDEMMDDESDANDESEENLEEEEGIENDDNDRNEENYNGDESDENEENEEDNEGDDNNEGDGYSECSGCSECIEQPEPKLLALWNAFRYIPRDHFPEVTAAFARSGVHFDCFGPESTEWILAIRDAAKVEVQETGFWDVVEEEL